MNFNVSDLSSLSFKVSDFVTLRLEEGRTIIYVNNEKFIQCKGLFISDPHLYENITSVDDIEDVESKIVQEDERSGISPEEEFWGHCSNLQVWIEQDYDTRLLHSNIAFPLLKRLADIGDSKALKMLKIEIIERFAEGSPSTREYLIESEFIDFLSEEEIRGVLKIDEVNALYSIEEELTTVFKMARNLEELRSLELIEDSLYLIEGAHIVGVRYYLPSEARIPENISKFSKLKYLILTCNELNAFPDSFSKLKELEVLDLSHNKFESLSEYFKGFSKLKKFNLFFNKFTSIPKVLLEMKLLSELYLYGNPIQHFPKRIGKLKEDNNSYFIKKK